MEYIISQLKTKSPQPARKVGGVSTIIGGLLQLFSTPVRTGTSSTYPDGSAQNPSNSTPRGTPKRSVIFEGSNNIKVGYFGKLGILDNQSSFVEVFGDKSIILDPNIIMSHDSTSTARSLYLFGKDCKLDVFLHMCSKLYVGYNSVDNSFSIQDVFRQVL